MMQAIWSRTAQTRSCRCRSCFHAATTVARRATTAASRRRLKVSDIFTACYSTILATAAVADAKVKEDRRKEWDRAIAEAKETTSWADLCVDGEFGEDIKSPGVLSGTEPEFKRYSPWKDAEARYTAPSIFETRLKALDREIRESTQEFSHVEREGAQDSGQLQNTSELEWIDEDPDEILPERDPKCPLHLERRELSCASLVGQLLTRLVGSIQRRTQSSSAQKDHPELKDMVVRINHLQSGHKKLPTYKWEDLAVIDQERRALHRSLLEICDEAVFDDIPSLELMLAKICYSLLLSSSPVSMVTYNILIQALGRLKQYDLAQVFVDSFLYETKFKPNRNSIRIILEHYHQKKDVEGWRAIMRRMRATEGDMRIKRRWHEDLDILPIQDWIYRTNPRDLKYQTNIKFLTQKPPRDSNIFDALIRTSLTFNGPRNAIMHIKRALLDYQEVYSDTICAVMEELLRRRDGRGSTSLIHQILTLWDENGDPSAIMFTDAVRRLIYQLLDMIGVDTTLGSQLTPPNKLPLRKMQAMLRQLRILSIEDSVSRTEDFVATIEDHLEDVYYSQANVVKGGDAQQGLDSSHGLEPVEEIEALQEPVPLHSEHSLLVQSQDSESLSTSEMAEVEVAPAKETPSLEWFSEVEKARANDLAWNTASGRWNRLDLLDSQLDYSNQKIEALRAQVLPFALKAMPHYQQLRYLDITSSSTVYRNKKERPSQYEELLRVRNEGAMGLLSYIEKQLLFRQAILSKIEAEVFSMKVAVNILGYLGLGFYLKRAAEHLLISERKAAHLEIKIAELFHAQELLQLDKEQPYNDERSNNFQMSDTVITVDEYHNSRRLENISKEIWKLERSADKVNIHREKSHQMLENVHNSFRTRLLGKLSYMINLNARILCKYEDQILLLGPHTLKPTLMKVARMVGLSERQISDLAAETNILRRQWETREYSMMLHADASLSDSKPQVGELAVQVDVAHQHTQDKQMLRLSKRAARGKEKFGIEFMVAASKARCMELKAEIRRIPCEVNDRRRRKEMVAHVRRGLRKFGLAGMVGQSGNKMIVLEREVLKFRQQWQARIKDQQVSKRIALGLQQASVDKVTTSSTAKIARSAFQSNHEMAADAPIAVDMAKSQYNKVEQTPGLSLPPSVLPVLELVPTSDIEEESVAVAAAAA